MVYRRFFASKDYVVSETRRHTTTHTTKTRCETWGNKKYYYKLYYYYPKPITHKRKRDI